VSSRGPRKAAVEGEWEGRLAQAREFREAAGHLVTLAENKSYNGAVVLMINAAIAYADAVTARLKGIVNKQDHQAAPRLLREVLGNALPDRQERTFKRLLSRKDGVSYGARSTLHEEARQLLAALDEFAIWAESMI